MRRVILTSGPRGAGKSNYVDDFVKNNSKFKLLSRDKLLIELFGKTSLDSYSGGHEYAYKIFFDKIEKTLKKSKNINLIVDCWNGWSSERESMIRKFRNYGADRVLCWKFMTPLDICLDWFMKKKIVGDILSIQSEMITLFIMKNPRIYRKMDLMRFI